MAALKQDIIFKWSLSFIFKNGDEHMELWFMSRRDGSVDKSLAAQARGTKRRSLDLHFKQRKL